MSEHTTTPLADLTGAELFVFEADAAAHGSDDELAAARAEILRRTAAAGAAGTRAAA